MDYKKKSLNKINQNETYEEIDTRLASGWYVDTLGIKKDKKYKTKKVSYKISKKIWIILEFLKLTFSRQAYSNLKAYWKKYIIY